MFSKEASEIKSLIILSSMLFDFEGVLESNRLVTMDLCSLSTFLKVEVECIFVHLFLIAKYTWKELYHRINSSRF